MPRVLTVLEAHVLPARQADLQKAYRSAAQDAFPPGLVRSSLLQLRATVRCGGLRHSGNPGKFSMRCEKRARHVVFRSFAMQGQNRH